MCVSCWVQSELGSKLLPSQLAPTADSDDEGARTARTARTKLTEGGRSRGQQSRRVAGGAGLLAASHAGADPVDLLDRGASRQLAAAAAGRRPQRRGGDDGPEFGTDAAGRMIIKVRCCSWACAQWLRRRLPTVLHSPLKPLCCLLTRTVVASIPPQDDRAAKRKRHDDGWDSEDSDFEDLKVRSCCHSLLLILVPGLAWAFYIIGNCCIAAPAWRADVRFKLFCVWVPPFKDICLGVPTLQGFERSGLSLALKGAKSVALAPSIAASLGGRSLGAKSAVSTGCGAGCR